MVLWRGNNIEKSQTDQEKNRQIIKIRIEKGNITNNFTEIKEYCKGVWWTIICQKLEILGNLDRFLERYKQMKLTQEAMENQSGYI